MTSTEDESPDLSAQESEAEGEAEVPEAQTEPQPSNKGSVETAEPSGPTQLGGIQPGLELLADGLLAGLLAVLVIRTGLPPRPLALPTGASAAGVVVLGFLNGGCGVALSVRSALVDRGPRWPIDALLTSGTILISSLVVLPVLGVSLPATALLLGVVGLSAFVTAASLAVADRTLLARRGTATLVDGLISIGLWQLLLHELLPATGTPAPSGASWTEVIGSLLLLAVCSMLVRVPFEAINGRSPGKRLVGLRVVDPDGDSPDTRAAVVRNLLRPLDSLPVGYVVGTALLAAGGSDRRLGDIVAGTRVERVA